MTYQDPKVEFVPIDTKDVVACSLCTNGEVKASVEICGCTDGVAYGMTGMNQGTCPEGEFEWLE